MNLRRWSKREQEACSSTDDACVGQPKRRCHELCTLQGLFPMAWRAFMFILGRSACPSQIHLSLSTPLPHLIPPQRCVTIFPDLRVGLRATAVSTHPCTSLACIGRHLPLPCHCALAVSSGAVFQRPSTGLRSDGALCDAGNPADNP